MEVHSASSMVPEARRFQGRSRTSVGRTSYRSLLCPMSTYMKRRKGDDEGGGNTAYPRSTWHMGRQQIAEQKRLFDDFDPKAAAREVTLVLRIRR